MESTDTSAADTQLRTADFVITTDFDSLPPEIILYDIIIKNTAF